jgi:predicted ATPase
VWDIARIESETDVTENVADIIVKRIDNLPENARNLLKIASCLGSQFELALVALIVISERNMSGSHVDSPTRPIFGDVSGIQVEIDPSEVEKDFDFLYQTGLVREGKSGFAKFAHEKVQQASYELIPEGPERDQLHLRIGKLLCDLHDDNSFDEEWIFFSAVDQFNKVSSCIKHEDDILAVIKLNLNAAELALGKSAFIVALTYLNAGVRLIERSACDYWNLFIIACALICTVLLLRWNSVSEMRRNVSSWSMKCLSIVAR